MNAEFLINKLMEYYNLTTISELSEKIKIGQPAISKWKNKNSITPIKKKCQELGIYDEIFKDTQENSKKTELGNNCDLSKYFTALQSVAIATNKENELLTDIKELIKKYIQ